MVDRSILVVGAGPVGLTAAVELARRGVRPQVIDMKAAPVRESRALAVNPRSLAILAPAGLAPRLTDVGTPIRKAYLRDRDSVRLQIDLSQLPKPYDFMLMLPQSETERVLAAHLDQEGIVIERSTTLVSLSQAEDGITAEVQAADGTRSLRHPQCVIGADGAHSAVRHAIGQNFKGSAYEYRWGLADATVETNLPLDGITIFDRAPVLFALFPINGNRVRLLCDRENLQAHVPPEIRIAELHWSTPFRISHRLVDSYQSGQVFLVGDAAHIHSPFGGRGMNLGIEDAAWLAWLIAEGDTAGFTEARRPVAQQVIRTVDPATRLMAADSLPAKFARRRLIPLLGALGLVQRRLLSVISAQDTPFPPWLRV